MANSYKTIHDLTALGTPDAADEVEVWDASASVSKRSTVTELAAAVTSAGGIATDAEITSAISTHSAAADPHGDRAFATAAVSALSTVYQPLDSDLTAIAALTTTAYGRALLALADAAALRTAAGLGSLATLSTVGTSQITDASITTAKLADGAVATIDIADGAVTSAKILDGTIINADVNASAAIATSKVAFGTTGKSLADTTTAAAANAVLGVTRQLVTFSTATPSLISGNLMTIGMQTGQSGWINATGGTSSAVASSGADGGGANRITLTTAAGEPYNITNLTPCTGLDGTSVTISARVKSTVSGTRGVYITAFFYDAGATLTGSFSSTATPTTIQAGVTTTTSLTGTVPAGTTQVRVGVVAKTGTGWSIGDILETSVACVRTSATIPGSSGVSGVTTAGTAACVQVDATTGRLVITSAGSGGGGYDAATLVNASSKPATATAVSIVSAARIQRAAASRAVSFRVGNSDGTNVDHDITLDSNGRMQVVRTGLTNRLLPTVSPTLYFSTGSPGNGDELHIDPLLVEWIAA